MTRQRYLDSRIVPSFRYIAVEKQMGQISHQAVMPPSSAISSEANNVLIIRSHGAPSRRFTTLSTEATVNSIEISPKHSLWL